MHYNTGRFLDATLQKMPNRRRGIEALLASIDAGGGATRAAVLDRWGQHTAICPDSRAAHRNIRAMAWAAAAVAVAATLALALPPLLLGPTSPLQAAVGHFLSVSRCCLNIIFKAEPAWLQTII